MSWILNHEPAVRLGAFLGIFAVMALWELVGARRRLTTAKGARWFANLGITILNTVVVRLVFPGAAVGVAVLAADRGWGLLNQVSAPSTLSIVGAVLLLDLAIYLQHVMFHAIPILWRLHMVHHADVDFDVTTGLRFHPVEIVLSMLIKVAVISALGPPVVAVLIFEVLLNATAMFNHGNVRLALSLDHVVRWFVVTPDMHRVHHSVVVRETNSNFGFNLPWWDRLLGTYVAQPAAGHEALTIGLEQYQDQCRQTLPWMLVQPFTGRTGRYPVGGDGEDRS
jgi:sterol desaturase/sphingolipid hydroxylase (fatty acid hydroxylase superfamily)